jgi:hypothetical protein
MSSSKPSKKTDKSVIGQSIILVLLVWAFLFNVIVKEQSLIVAFFEIIDTITEDLVMDSVMTIVVGVAIVSFRILEEMFFNDFAEKNYKKFTYRLLHFEEEKEPKEVHPEYGTTILIALSILYFTSWVYVLLFSEALFFVSWSAGVDLPINSENLQLLPTLALAIPFSARVMAYLRYPYAQDYADFMPGAVFILLLVGTLGYVFHSDDQQFFLMRVWNNEELFREFLRSGLILAFIPVFSEALFWMVHIFMDEED